MQEAQKAAALGRKNRRPREYFMAPEKPMVAGLSGFVSKGSDGRLSESSTPPLEQRKTKGRLMAKEDKPRSVVPRERKDPKTSPKDKKQLAASA